MISERSVWVWMIYLPESKALVGAIRCSEMACWTAAGARHEVEAHAAELRTGHIEWREVDAQTLVGDSDLGYICVIRSVRLPPERPDHYHWADTSEGR
jgi:hypothetical protein